MIVLCDRRMKPVTGALIMAVLVLSATQATAAALKITCLDESTRVPVGGVRLAATVDSTLTYYVTDSQGICNVPVPEEGPSSLVALTFVADSYVPVVVEWRVGSQPIPEEHTVLLEPGTVIGGTILTSDGEPVPNASVSVTLPVVERDGRQVLVRDYVVESDANGTWQCGVIPESLVSVHLQVDVESLSVYQSVQYGKGARPLAPLRDLSDRIVLEERCVAYGGVLAPDGTPVSGATVAVWLTDGSWRDARLATTDAWGRFKVTGCKPGNSTFFVQARGWAPQLQHGEVAKAALGRTVVLEKGQPLRVRVVDAGGEPLPGAWVTVEAWRGLEGVLDWQSFVDESGEATWENAPLEGLSLLAETAGAQPSTIKIPRVKDELYTIRIGSTTRIRGRVVEDDTGAPVATFEVIPGIRYQQQETIHWMSSQRFEGAGGEFSFTLPRDDQTADFLKIVAPGKAPWISSEIPSQQDVFEVTAQLKKAAPLRGRALDAAGNPVQGASVFLCSPSDGLYLRNGRLASEFFGAVAETGADGAFEFSPESPPFTLVVLADSGCAVSPDNEWSPETAITVQPWAALEGTIRCGDTVFADRAFRMALSVDIGGVPAPFFEYQGRTDDTGGYALDRLPPLACRLVFDVAMPDGSGFQWPTEPLKLQAGTEAEANIGGIGQPVSGEVPLPDDALPQGQGNLLCTVRKSGGGGSCGDVQFQAWASVSPDGLFRFPEVPPGTYLASVSVPRIAFEGAEDTSLVRYETAFEVVPRDEGQLPQPMELGELAPVARQASDAGGANPGTMAGSSILKVGESVPGFEAKLLDGTPVSLGDFAGRYVLIDVWATWCGPCRGETPHLKKVYEDYGGDSRFAMLGISLDVDRAALESYVAREQLPWPQVFAEENPTLDVSSMWGINSIPAILLVGPDGTLVAQYLRGEAIGVAVRQVLRDSEDSKGGDHEQP